MIRRLALLILALAGTAYAAGVYRWVDEQGNVHYGDTPPAQGAERIQLRVPQPAGTAGGEAARSPTGQSTSQPGSPYGRVEVVQPQDGETVRNDQGNVRVQMVLDPRLAEGDYLELLLDGAVVGGKQTSVVLDLSGLQRGPHEVQAVVFNRDGSEQARSKVVRFFLRQTTPFERAEAEQTYRQWLNDLQQARAAERDAERRAEQERQQRAQAEQKARVEARRKSDFESKTGDSPRFEGGAAGYPGVPTTQPRQPSRYNRDRTDLTPSPRQPSSERRGELQTYDPAKLPKQPSGEPADYDPAKAPRSEPAPPHSGPGTNPTYAPSYTPPPATSGD